MSRASIAFVIPAYNAAPTVRGTLDSLVRQTRPDWEAIVVDDGSGDGTGDAARALGDARVQIVRQRNRGLAAARNAGLDLVRAPAVCFLDADDTVEPEYAERMLAALGASDFVACEYRYLGPDLRDLRWTIAVGPQDLTAERFGEFNPLVVGGVCVRTESARRASADGEVFRTALRVHEDWDLWLRMTRAGCRWGVPVERPLFNYRLRPDSMSTDLRLMWRTGLELIAGAGRHDPDSRLRRWTLRSLARAVAKDDAALAAEMLAETGPIVGEEVGVLVGALRWAFCRQELIGPAGAGPRLGDWAARTARMLAGQTVLPDLLARLASAGPCWESAVARAAAALRPGDPLVVYGLGRNGREALRAARRLGVPVAAIDDSPAAVTDAPRFNPGQLSPRHVVLVTPDDRAEIVQRLATLGVWRIVLPDEAA